MINIEYLKEKVKKVNVKDDRIVSYFKRSIAHSKDWADIVASVSVLNEHLQENYNINLLK